MQTKQWQLEYRYSPLNSFLMIKIKSNTMWHKPNKSPEDFSEWKYTYNTSGCLDYIYAKLQQNWSNSFIRWNNSQTDKQHFIFILVLIANCKSNMVWYGLDNQADSWCGQLNVEGSNVALHTMFNKIPTEQLEHFLNITLYL